MRLIPLAVIFFCVMFMPMAGQYLRRLVLLGIIFIALAVLIELTLSS